MLSVPSLRLNQFGVRFYEALLSGADLQSLVGFEVLSFGPAAQTTRGHAQGRPRAAGSTGSSWRRGFPPPSTPIQRPIIQKKIDELVAYYLQCADSGTLPAIPGSVLLVSERRLEFSPSGGRADSGSLKLPEESGILRALDGQHRLLALHQLAEKHNLKDFQVPAVVFDNLTRGPGGRALRHDQQQAHEAEPLAPDLALGPPPLPGREPGRRPRRDPDAQRGRRLAAAGADQGPRHRAGSGHPGVARRRAARRLRGDGRRGRPRLPGVPRERAPLLPQLLQSRRPGLPDRLRTAASTRSRARRRCEPSSASSPTSSP